jgi:hypothetical protein
MTDLNLLRLQYEYLDLSIAELAAAEEVPVSVMTQEIKNNGWRRLWPTVLTRPDQYASDEDKALYREQFLEDGKNRLKIFSLAKEILLAHRYMKLENSILVAADSMAQNPALKPSDLKALSSLYKDLHAGTTLGNLSSISFTADEDGIPTAIIRNLSGQPDK